MSRLCNFRDLEQDTCRNCRETAGRGNKTPHISEEGKARGCLQAGENRDSSHSRDWRRKDLRGEGVRRKCIPLLEERKIVQKMESKPCQRHKA